MNKKELLKILEPFDDDILILVPIDDKGKKYKECFVNYLHVEFTERDDQNHFVYQRSTENCSEGALFIF
jgi:hypothetical protein